MRPNQSFGRFLKTMHKLNALLHAKLSLFLPTIFDFERFFPTHQRSERIGNSFQRFVNCRFLG
ncbi:MAG: hypothetical protein CML57_07995 [Rhodobacteraceae bacterium]|nr:hypothetical protein [Paracoccaceae bacterium]